jgi:hypothetical protein
MLSVAVAGLASPLTATLTGTGVAPSGSATLSPALTFSQNLGTTSASQPVTLTNPGGSGSLLISNIGITGTNATNFAQTNNCGGNLAAGASCTINVTFTPPATTGLRSATLSVTSSAPALSVSLSGTGTQAAVVFSPAQPAGLMTLAADTTVKNGTLTVTNTGNGPLTITALPTVARLTGTGTFAVINVGTTCTATAVVAANGGTCAIHIRYTPPTTGGVMSTAQVTVTGSGGAQSQYNVTVSAN